MIDKINELNQRVIDLMLEKEQLKLEIEKLRVASRNGYHDEIESLKQENIMLRQRLEKYDI